MASHLIYYRQIDGLYSMFISYEEIDLYKLLAMLSHFIYKTPLSVTKSQKQTDFCSSVNI